MLSSGSNILSYAAFLIRSKQLRFLDPNCGCGNFLVITYRELRLLEQEILERLFHDRRATGQILHSQAWQIVPIPQPI